MFKNAKALKGNIAASEGDN